MTRDLGKSNNMIDGTELIKLGGLYNNTTSSGQDCMVGQVCTSSRLVVIKNPKTGPDEPPYNIYLAPVEHKPEKISAW
jgi:hypothetical protein